MQVVVPFQRILSIYTPAHDSKGLSVIQLAQSQYNLQLSSALGGVVTVCEKPHAQTLRRGEGIGLIPRAC